MKKKEFFYFLTIRNLNLKYSVFPNNNWSAVSKKFFKCPEEQFVKNFPSKNCYAIKFFLELYWKF